MKYYYQKMIRFMFLLIASMFVVMSFAYAGTSTIGNTVSYGDNSGLADQLRRVPDFKFWNHTNGIGYGNCPVYTAPSEDAFRCANGKASVYTNSYMSEAGFVNGWLLVRYETNNGGVRVGYIPPRYVNGFQSKMGRPQFDYIPVTASGTIAVTDNPLLKGSSFARLDSGETFHILAKYTYFGNWWYIECTVDGQIARGFIDRGSSSFVLGTGDTGGASGSAVTLQTLGNPSVSPLGTSQDGEVLIDSGNTGNRKFVRERPDPNSAQVSVVYPGRRYPCYAIRMGTTGKEWYYIWVEQDSTWGWVSSAFSTVMY